MLREASGSTDFVMIFHSINFRFGFVNLLKSFKYIRVRILCVLFFAAQPIFFNRVGQLALPFPHITQHAKRNKERRLCEKWRKTYLFSPSPLAWTPDSFSREKATTSTLHSMNDFIKTLRCCVCVVCARKPNNENDDDCRETMTARRKQRHAKTTVHTLCMNFWWIIFRILLFRRGVDDDDDDNDCEMRCQCHVVRACRSRCHIIIAWDDAAWKEDEKNTALKCYDLFGVCVEP